MLSFEKYLIFKYKIFFSKFIDFNRGKIPLQNSHHNPNSPSSLAICEERILKRAESGDRADDNLETLRKRFKSYEEIQLPIINIYKEQVCVKINK